MKSNREQSKITFTLPKKQHLYLKSRAASLGKSLREVILDSLQMSEACINSDHNPNQETLKAIRNAEKGLGTKTAKNFTDILKKLDH